jgi:energy-coupling factor transporter ATP-binding protein EcfA2
MNSNPIIGLIGPKRSGKSTVFNILKSIEPKIVEVQLAKKLKDVCSSVFNIERTHFDDQNFKEVEFTKPIIVSEENIFKINEAFNIQTNSLTDFNTITVVKTPRQLLQHVGTDILRGYDPLIHCRSLEMSDQDAIYVVTDIRFLNEHGFFMNKQNFYPVYVQRDEAETLLDSHASEQEAQFLKEYSYILENNDTIENLEEKIKDYLTLLS